MTKDQIINEIRRIAEANSGKAPGTQKFSTETGIRKSAWYPNLWLRWSDAISEAGYQPNKLATAYDVEHLIEKYIELIREVGHFPIEGELIQKRKSDSNYPDRGAFSQLGSKQERIQRIVEYCGDQREFEDIVRHWLAAESQTTSNRVVEENPNDRTGYVYLIQHGSRKEYKIGMTYNPIRREGEIRLELPERVRPIHYIETDDPYGIEAYWHSRFADKRKEGEWFALSAIDVSAFKRWRKIY